MIGTKIGNYAVIEQIGEGGMGAVYAAKHTLLDKTVAVKVLLPQYSSNEEVVSRFFNEAKATTMVDHPGIVELYDFGHLDDGSAYIIMELLVGESLDDRIDKVGRMPFTEAARVVSRIAGILKAAHEHDIVHRDIKPENIFLVPDPGVEERERPKILDFGIAKLNDESNPNALSKVKTRTGSIIGSPLYMSPEQCKGAGRVDFRSDIYSLGCILYELLCGAPPFDGEGTGEIIGAHLHVAPTDPTEIVSTIPDGLGAVVLKSLAKKPKDRYQSMDEFASSLRRYCSATIGGPGRGSGGTTPWGEKAIPTPPPVSAVASTKSGSGGELEDDDELAFGRTRTPVPTTLGLSTESSIVEVPEESRGSKILGILVAGSLAAAGVAYWKVSASADSNATRSNASASAELAPASEVKAEPAPATEPAPSEVTLKIDSKPAGAAIHAASDNQILGHAPLVLTRPTGEGALELVLRHEGHLDAPLSISLSEDATELVALKLAAEEESKESTKTVKTARASAKAKARALAKARAAKAAAKAKAKAAAKAKAKAAAKAKAKAAAKTKKAPLTQPKAKTERAGDGALNPFNN